MRPTEQLKAEHEGVQLMLKILDKICGKLDAREEIDGGHVAGMLDFSRSL